jgi:translation elongation factor EF-4
VCSSDLLMATVCHSECEQVEHSYLGKDRALLRYRMPLAEIATEFHDRVKTISSGYCRCCRSFSCGAGLFNSISVPYRKTGKA